MEHIKKLFPCNTINSESDRSRLEKKFFGLELFKRSGLFDHLNSLQNIESNFFVGKFAKGDWIKSSEIDSFVFGDSHAFLKARFESILSKDMQLLENQDSKKIKKELDPNLQLSIIKEFNIKGNLEPFKVKLE